MADLLLVTLEFLHIVFGVAWIGAVFYSVAVLRRAIPRVSAPARKEAMKQIIPVASHFIPMVAIATIVFGTLLYLFEGRFDPEVLFGSRWGVTILTAFVLSVGAFAFGMIFAMGSGSRILVHLEEDHCTHPDTVSGLQRRMNSAQIVVLILGFVILGLMVAASAGV